MNQPIINYFLTNTFSKTQAIRRLRLTKEFIDVFLFKNLQKKDFKTVFESFKQTSSAYFISQEGLEEDFIFLEKIAGELIKSISAENVNESFKLLEDAISHAKIILIYLPFEAPEQEINKLGSWFKQNLGPTSLIEINYDPGLIGGCALSFNGMYKDYSLRARINENKKQILDVLLSYHKNE